MRLLNFTATSLLFAHLDNLTPVNNGRYEVASRDLLVQREYLYPEGKHALRVNLRVDTLQLSFGIPVIKETLIGADPLPAGDDLLIVSHQYAQACRRLCWSTARLRTVCGPVYLPGEHFPIACTALSFVEACMPHKLPELFVGRTTSKEELEQYIRDNRHKMDLSQKNHRQYQQYVRENPLTADECFPPLEPTRIDTTSLTD